MTNGEKIAQAAYGWLGTPHVNYAKVKGVGVDCGMLLIGTLEDTGVIEKNSIRITPYSNEWHLHRSEEWFLGYVEKYCEKVTDLKVGDFLLYQYGRCISHAAIYVGNGHVVQACINQGVILTGMDDVMFVDAHGESRLRGIYRFQASKKPRAGRKK